MEYILRTRILKEFADSLSVFVLNFNGLETENLVIPSAETETFRSLKTQSTLLGAPKTQIKAVLRLF